MLLERIITADVLDGLKQLEDKSVDMCVTSPPYYGLRDYKVEGQIGLENSPEEYVNKLVMVFREVKRVLKDDGTFWLNIGDSYNGYKGNAHSETSGSEYAGYRNQPTRESGYGLECKNLKPKDLMGIPWALAFALRADGWYLRQDIIWCKRNTMPESVTDRCTKSHEYIFLLSKSEKYYFDNEAIQEPAAYDGRKDTVFKGGVKYVGKDIYPEGTSPQSILLKEHERWRKNEDGVYVRNKRSVWTVGTYCYKGAHFATFPPDLIRPCILAGCKKGGVVLDPFFGSGTTGEVCIQEMRGYIGIELNPEFAKLAEERCTKARNDNLVRETKLF